MTETPGIWGRINQMLVNLTPAIATSFSAILVFVTGWFSRTLTRKQFVAKERLVWIKDIRGLCAQLCALCEQYEEDTLPENQRTNFLTAKNGILIRLDPKGHYKTDDRLIELLEDRSFTEVRENITEIRQILMAVNKSEWDKAKNEAGNGFFVRRKNDKTQSNVEDELKKIAANLKKGTNHSN